jgi:hypothetical protein
MCKERDVFLNQKRVNVCEYTVKMMPYDSFGCGEEWTGWRVKLNGNYLKLIPGLCPADGMN